MLVAVKKNNGVKRGGQPWRQMKEIVWAVKIIRIGSHLYLIPDL